MSARCIKFRYDVVHQANIKAQFAARDVFQNVIGVIDCTHITMKALPEEIFAYYCADSWLSELLKSCALPTNGVRYWVVLVV